MIQGWMEKKGHVMPTWKRRYFSFDKGKRLLSYYSDEEKRHFRSDYNVVANSIVEVMEQGLDKHQFVIKLTGQTHGKDSVLYMAASSMEDRERWFEIFAEVIWGVKVNQPKLCEMFRNQVPLDIHYGSTQADDGCILLPEITKDIPLVKYYVPPQGGGYYCLIMINPDPPSFTDSTDRRKSVFGFTNYRNYAHWVVCNIPGDDVSAGSCILDYVPSCPVYNTGLQRHFFVLFMQGEKFLNAEEVVEAEAYFKQRGGLRICQWAEEQGFGLPVGINGFQTKWSAYCDEVHKEPGFMPPAEYRSPGQVGWLERIQLEKQLHDAQVAAEEKAKIDAAVMQQNAENSKLYERGTDVSTLIVGFKIKSKQVFEGIWVKKKFSDNYSTKSRFIWIDVPDAKFYWKKTEGISLEDGKSLSIKEEFQSVKVNDSNNGFDVSLTDGRGLKVVFPDGNKLQLSQDFVSVMERLHPGLTA